MGRDEKNKIIASKLLKLCVEDRTVMRVLAEAMVVDQDGTMALVHCIELLVYEKKRLLTSSQVPRK